MNDNEHTHRIEVDGHDALHQRASAVFQHIAPIEWDATVWLPSSNYIAGRLDVADAHRLIGKVLSVIEEAPAVAADDTSISDHLHQLTALLEEVDHPAAASLREAIGEAVTAMPYNELVQRRPVADHG